MKHFIPGFLLYFIAATSASAQDIRLNDSVIFINDTPVALYAKTLNSGTPGYNMEVYSFDDYVLIKAEVIKFNAPVKDLKPFYYYELTFPPTADTFAVYIEDEAFPVVLAKMIRDYDLINKNELNKRNVTRFIAQFYGGPALTEKIKSVEDYLNETRYFNEQVKRDRTKPVTIVNERIIMQDGVRIGEFSNSIINSGTSKIQTPGPVVYDSSRRGVTQRVYSDYVTNTTTQSVILLDNGRQVDIKRYYYFNPNQEGNKFWKSKSGSELYQLSIAANKGRIYSEDKLWFICNLIDDYFL